MPSDTLEAPGSVAATTCGSVDTQSVIAYLVEHPDFFVDHEELLTRLVIPHQSGAAVSLIERQVTVLRERCHSLESRLCDLISVAHQNEQLHQRVHHLIQDIISAESLGDVIALTTDCLHEHFHADDVRVVLIADTAAEDDTPADATVRIDAADPRLQPFDTCLTQRRTLCGPLGEALQSLAYDGDRADLQSAAVIPLVSGRRYGLLVLGSRDEHRFAGDIGVLFLDQLGDVLSRRLNTLPVAV